MNCKLTLKVCRQTSGLWRVFEWDILEAKYQKSWIYWLYVLLLVLEESTLFLIFFYLNMACGCSLVFCKGRSLKTYLKPDNYSELQATDFILFLRFFNSIILVMIIMVVSIWVAESEILSFWLFTKHLFSQCFFQYIQLQPCAFVAL